MIVDISSESTKDSNASPKSPVEQPSQQYLASKRPTLVHQTSLSGAVGAASEAGKLIASKLATEVNLKGAKAKEIMMAAANHLTNPSSQIKFHNLRGDDDDEEEEEEGYDDEEQESTNLDGEDEEDDGRMNSSTQRLQRAKKTRRLGPQSAFSAALPYKLKQKLQGGYQKAAAFDEEDEDDEDEDESAKLRRSPSAKTRRKPNERRSQEGEDGGGSSTDDARKPTGSGKLLESDLKGKRNSRQKRRSRRQQMKATPAVLYEEPEESGEFDDKTYKCLDNTVALLIKTRLEETILRIAVGAIMLVAIGIFVLFSLPPAGPDKQIIDMLVEKL